MYRKSNIVNRNHLSIRGKDMFPVEVPQNKGSQKQMSWEHKMCQAQSKKNQNKVINYLDNSDCNVHYYIGGKCYVAIAVYFVT